MKRRLWVAAGVCCFAAGYGLAVGNLSADGTPNGLALAIGLLTIAGGLACARGLQQ